MKQNETNKKRKTVRKRNEGKRELKQNERIQNREVWVEKDLNLSRFFESATTNKNILTG